MHQNEPVIDLPPVNGCKPDWWAFGGYCYKEFAYVQHLVDYASANESCDQDWSGAQVALLPIIEPTRFSFG